MIRKGIGYFFLVCVAAVLLVGVLIQLPSIQNKLIHWIEKKSDGELSIGKVEGFIPFWIKLQDVHYKTEELEASIDQAILTLAPLRLFSPHSLVLNVQIEQLEMHSKKDGWPTFDYPLLLHSFSIAHLDYNDYRDLTVSGKADLSQNFAFQVEITSPRFEQTHLHLDIDAHSNSQTIELRAYLKHAEQINLRLCGQYSWKTSTFIGTLHGTGPQFKISAEVELTQNKLALHSLDFALNGTRLLGNLDYNLHTQQLEMESSILDYPFSLDTPLLLTQHSIKASALTLQSADNILQGELSYSFQENTFCGELDLELHSSGSGKGKLTFDQTQISFLLEAEHLQWKDLYLSQLNASVDWSPKIGAHVELDLHELTSLNPDYEIFPSLNIGLIGSVSQNDLLFEGSLLGFGETPMCLSGNLPFILSFSPFDLKMDDARPFSLQIQGSGSIDPLLAFLENASLIAHGGIDLNLSAFGTWNDPQLAGYLNYTNGSIESLTTGALFRDIQLKMEAEGQELQIQSLSAHDFAKGDLTGNGALHWNPKEGFPFAFRFFASRYALLTLDPFTATIDAEIEMIGTLNEISIAGNATVVDAHLAIPNKMPVQIPTVEVSYLHPIDPQTETEQKKTIPIYWDVEILAPRSLLIEGRGIHSEWSGQLSISGEQNALEYHGKLKLVAGRFSLINRTFDLVQGKVRIDGLEPKNIYVDLRGDYELPTLTTSILVLGSLDNTHISFCSNPPMSTNQILSWIVFNQDINELSPFQACRLASLLVSISGTYSGPKTFDSIKSGLGIDVFSITDCDIDSNDLTFQVGKYISQGTFVGVNKSISGDFDSVMIQTRLYRDFFLEADYGGSLNGLTPNGGKAVFKWYKSY